MWTFLRVFGLLRENDKSQNIRRAFRIPQLCVSELVSLCHRASDRLMIFDLRASSEVEEHPYVIPGALLTIHVDLLSLVPWIPPDTIVILYAALNIAAQSVWTKRPPRPLRLYALEGGLRFWRDAGQPLEKIVLSDRRPVGI